jgi:hypothetical protein
MEDVLEDDLLSQSSFEVESALFENGDVGATKLVGFGPDPVQIETVLRIALQKGQKGCEVAPVHFGLLGARLFDQKGDLSVAIDVIEIAETPVPDHRPLERDLKELTGRPPVSIGRSDRPEIPVDLIAG